MSHPDDLLADYVDGTLDEGARADVDTHLLGCERCRDEVRLAASAKAGNRRNGALVHSHLAFTGNALHYLQAAAVPFYGPDGIRKAAGGMGTRLALG